MLLDTRNKLLSSNDGSTSLMKSMKSKGPKERNLKRFSKALRTFLLMRRCFSHCRSLDRTVSTLAVVKRNSLNFLRQINHGCTRSKCHRSEPPFHILHIFMGGRLGNMRGFDMEEQDKRPPLGWVTHHKNIIYMPLSSLDQIVRAGCRPRAICLHCIPTVT